MDAGKEDIPGSLSLARHAPNVAMLALHMRHTRTGHTRYTYV